MLKHCSLRRIAVAALGTFVIAAAALVAGGAGAQIIVGQTAGFSGAVAATVKEATEGAKLYIDAVNARGGVNGQKIEHVMLDKLSGQVAYAVMSFGGFLGIGARFHPLPWGALKYDTAKEGYVVDLDKKTLEEAPTTEAFDTPLWEDELWNRKVYDYYKQPFWRE